MLEMTSAIKSDRASENVKAQSEKNPTKIGQRMYAVRVDRVRERMAVLRLTAKEVTSQSGFARTYLADLLEGKKEKIRAGAIESLASTLDCSVAFLRGLEDCARPILISQNGDDAQLQGFATEPNDRSLIEVGEVEVGRFKLPREMGSPVTIPPEPDYIGSRQCVFSIVGDDLSREGMPNGSSVVCVNVDDALAQKRSRLSEGHTVLVVTESSKHPGREFSLWEVVREGPDLTLAPLGRAGGNQEVLFGDSLDMEDRGYRLSIRFLVTQMTRPLKK